MEDVIYWELLESLLEMGYSPEDANNIAKRESERLIYHFYE